MNDTTHGNLNPGFYRVNGGTITSTSGVIQANDTIDLYNTDQQYDATFTVPSELAIESSVAAPAVWIDHGNSDLSQEDIYTQVNIIMLVWLTIILWVPSQVSIQIIHLRPV